MEPRGTIVAGLIKTEREVVHGTLVRHFDPESSPPRMTRSELHLPTGGVLEQRWKAWGSDRDWPTFEEALADRVAAEENPRLGDRVTTRFVTPWMAEDGRFAGP
jgi:hypothetical protein